MGEEQHEAEIQPFSSLVVVRRNLGAVRVFDARVRVGRQLAELARTIP